MMKVLCAWIDLNIVRGDGVLEVGFGSKYAPVLSSLVMTLSTGTICVLVFAVVVFCLLSSCAL